MQLPPRVNIETIYHNQRTSGLSPRTSLKEEEEEKEEEKKCAKRDRLLKKKVVQWYKVIARSFCYRSGRRHMLDRTAEGASLEGVELPATVRYPPPPLM